MTDLYSALRNSLDTGFINMDWPSNSDYLPEILANDKTIGKKVLSTLKIKLRECDEFWFSVAFVTKSGVATLINLFEELRSKGIKGKVLVSQYQNFTQPEALKSLRQFENIELKIVVAGDFHAKGYLFKKGHMFDLIIGSSNLTANALCSNKEWNLKISAAPESRLINDALKEFGTEFESATSVDEEFIRKYELLYQSQKRFYFQNEQILDKFREIEIEPNEMQVEALENLQRLRKNGNKKALLISATGTGKTYLSAFDAKEFSTKRFLFIVHRANIAEAAMNSFKKIFGEKRSMGMFSGKRKETDAEFIFSTIQTLSKDDNLRKFESTHFDYVVIDETHRAGAATYQKILRYFNPGFLLGMTATPERMDGFDIFAEFDHNIGYEIRLHKALEEKMLSPFHYFGVTDISIDGKLLEQDAAFSLLTATERIDRIIEKIEFYGCDTGQIRGLIFCSSQKESNQLSEEFNNRGYKTVSLLGDSSDEERSEAIRRIESDNVNESLDYIFTVDIFNEGVDIPRINQVIMLRPTQSAIVFVQQLGRGLRKTKDKEYLTVIDFIGNYSNNFMIPIALYGDKTYNKDHLRKMMATGSSLLPGSSTVNFDQIARDRIFRAIDSANLSQSRDLLNDYKLLKFKIGNVPLMMDFVEHGTRSPSLYVEKYKSYFNFVAKVESDFGEELSTEQRRYLELFSKEIANGKRVEEVLITLGLLKSGRYATSELTNELKEQYGIETSPLTIKSCVRNLNFEFVTEKQDKNLVSAKEKYGIEVVEMRGDQFCLSDGFQKHLENEVFYRFFQDLVNFGKSVFDHGYDKKKYFDGFTLYEKYSRKDVFRILNWDQNPVAQNVGGYIISQDKTNCPIFVNYHKQDDITDTTRYEDEFINSFEFDWMSKSRRTLSSPDVIAIKNHKQGLRLPLFIKKSNDEGMDFYYMGDVSPIEETFEQTTMPNENGGDVKVVKVRFQMNQPVEHSIYEYITTEH